MNVPTNLTIVLVESKSIYRSLLIQTLGNLGFTGKCIPVSSYSESLVKIKALMKKGEKIDLLISEMDLPDGNTLELIKKIRTSQKLGKLPILGVSGNESSEQIVKAFEAGIDNCMARPIDEDELLEKIEYCWMKRKKELVA